jgi:23S rRNA (uracil1939-C5)-methyltransferase
MPSANIEIEITSLDEQGRGLGRYKDREIAISYVVPGERIRIPRSALEDARGGREARPYAPTEENFVDLSSDRVDPPCPYFTRCGGCQLQHLSYVRQLQEKEAWLRRLVETWLPAEKVKPIVPSPQEWNYRRRVQLHVGPRGEVGFYAPQSQRVVDIQECLISDPAINQKISEVKVLAAEAVKARNRSSFLTYELTLQPSGAVEIQRPSEERGFLQVNAQANQKLQELLHKTVQEIAPQKVLELYAGNGNLTYSLVSPDLKWTAVESNLAAIQEGRGHAKTSLVEWIQGEAGKQLRSLLSKNYDLVLLDPPRQGAGNCIKSLGESPVPWLLYVSCYPPTLIRDLKALTRAGYEIEWLQPIDFFPQTMHLETVALCRHS